MQIVGAPDDADVFLSKSRMDPDEVPTTSMYAGELPYKEKVRYIAWDQYYYWVGKEGYQAVTGQVESTVKAGPLVGGMFGLLIWPLAPLVLWAWGPSEQPIRVNLKPLPGATAPAAPAPAAVPVAPPASPSDAAPVTSAPPAP